MSVAHVRIVSAGSFAGSSSKPTENYFLLACCPVETVPSAADRGTPESGRHFSRQGGRAISGLSWSSTYGRVCRKGEVFGTMTLRE